MRTPPWLLAMMLCAAIFAGGCATPAVWGIEHHAPAHVPKLWLAFAPEKHDILVQYEEGDDARVPQIKSYWLFAYSDIPPNDRIPQFISATNQPNLTPIPIVNWNAAPQEHGYSARLMGFTAFDLYHDGTDIGRFQLPDYTTHAQTVTVSRVLLTPPAVVADTLIVSGIFAIYVSPYVLEACARH